MDNSKSDKQCHFIEIIDDEAGPCSAVLSPPKGQISEGECKMLVRNWDSISEHSKSSFI